ncbi:MAG TPA: hypothetical protein VNE62_04470 [Actinomycetota bacterium]|nr:hypothetical protein [Actinomycetota bacterium]
MPARTRVPRRALAVIALIALAACGGQGVDSDDAPLVQFDSPTPGPQRVAVHTLAPGVTPTPRPTPPPTATPGPTAVPLAPPRSTSIRAAAGTQAGAPASYCWTSGAASRCQDFPPPSQPAGLAVRRGEAVLLVVDADRPPDSESIRPFQGERNSYPTQQIDPARETTLTIDLDPGEWHVDLCAAWTGNGQPCWLFRIQVS